MKTEEKVIVKAVTKTQGGYEVDTQTGISFFVDEKYGFEPKENDEITLHCVQGSTIRGMDLNGERKYYKSDEQLEQEHAAWVENNKTEKEKKFTENKDKMDAQYNSFPDVFKRRIDKFRTNNPNFRVDYEEYELFCCGQALAIANGLTNDQHLASIPDASHWVSMTTSDRFTAFDKAKTGLKNQVVPEFDGGYHSGNTYGMSMQLAFQYITEPENVVKMHGALATLVGSEEYGCVPRGEAAEPVE